MQSRGLSGCASRARSSPAPRRSLPICPNQILCHRSQREKPHQECVQGLSDELYHILQAAQRLPLEYSLTDLSAWVDEFAAREVDFNDVVYWKTCAQHNLIFVTHDADCAFMDIDIVSANRRLELSTGSSSLSTGSSSTAPEDKTEGPDSG
jgi:hypothetical protein